jgi:hypothetical protein
MEGVTHGLTDDGRPLCPYREPEDAATNDHSLIDCGICKGVLTGRFNREELFAQRAATLAGPGWKGG